MNPRKEKIKVLFAGRYNQSEVLSGPEKTAKRIFREYARHNPSVFIEYFFEGSRYGYSKKLFGKEIVEENSNYKIIRLGLLRILPEIRKYKPEIIHIITFERFAAVAVIYKLFGKVKIIYNAHGIITYENNTIRKVPFFYGLKDKFCEMLYLRYSDKIIFYSENAIDIAEKYFRIDESKVVILSNGIDTVFNRVFINRKNNSHPQLKIVIISDAQFIDKGLALLKEIIRYIKFPAEINLIGNIVSSSFHNGNGLVSVRFIGKMDASRLAEFYGDKDVYLSLREYETFSISAVEAMAAGLVPIVTKQTGMSRYILDNENGYIVEGLNAELISERINLLAESHELRRALSANSAKIYEFLSWEDVFDTFRNIYSALIKK